MSENEFISDSRYKDKYVINVDIESDKTEDYLEVEELEYSKDRTVDCLEDKSDLDSGLEDSSEEFEYDNFICTEEKTTDVDFQEFDIKSRDNTISDNSDKESKTKKPFAYIIFKLLLEKYNFKCWNGQIYYYYGLEGRFVQLSETQLKVLIRQGWDEEIQEKLSRNMVIEIIERLLTEPSIQVKEDYFNCETHLMNFLNGVLDLRRWKLKSHSPDYRFTSCIQSSFSFNPVGGEDFEEFLNTTMENDEEKKKHLQEVVGYILSEFYTAKKVPMIIGQPHSGKSTLNRIISSLIGTQQVANVPLHRLHERFILAHLSTKKVNICSEISDEALSNIEVFKAITGNDELVAEYKGKDHFTYKSKIKLLFSGNCMPALKNQDITTAFFDRLTFINFKYSIPEEDRKHDLEIKLLNKDREYIVYWAVQGIKRLMNKNFVFSETEESRAFKKKYIEEQNSTMDFVKSNCVFGVREKVHLRVLYDEYLNYCHNNCFSALCKEKFFVEISKYDVIKKKFRKDGSAPLWGYMGIGIQMDI